MILMIVRRLLILPLLLLCSAGLVFLLAWVSPYDPVEAYVMAYGPNIDAELRSQYTAVWGLHVPAHTQFFQWLRNPMSGDWGQSRLLGGQPVAEALLARLGPSVILVSTSLGVAMLWGLVAGILAAAFRDTWVDYLIRATSFFSAFAPSFWIALLALYVFAVQWSLLPAGGIADPDHRQGASSWPILHCPL